MSHRIRNAQLASRIVTAEEAAGWIEDGMTVAFGGFAEAGEPKAVPRALVERVRREGRPFQINLFTGASINEEIEGLFAEAGIVDLRLPYQAQKKMRASINAGNVRYIDQHLSHTAEFVRQGTLPPIDVAIVEAVAITEEGWIVPSTAVGNCPIFVEKAKTVIVEVNEAQPESLEGVHDIYLPGVQGQREPLPLTRGDMRIGTTAMRVSPDKIRGIVITNEQDVPPQLAIPDEETERMADFLLDFLRHEVKKGRLPSQLPPLQSGVGSVSNAVLHGFLHAGLGQLEVYSEVLQDAVFELMDAGIVRYASASSITLSPKMEKAVMKDFDRYRDRLILRSQEISNNPEIIRRLGLISVNGCIEVDIYGHVNSTHVLGTNMMNGIGGSGDFARNARLTVFVTKSIAKGGAISSIVPFASHVDHTEHDVDIIVTEQGLADLRGLAPRDRALAIINTCAHPMYRPQLLEYFEEAVARGGHEPHVLEKALMWHVRYQQEGTMLEKS